MQKNYLQQEDKQEAKRKTQTKENESTIMTQAI